MQKRRLVQHLAQIERVRDVQRLSAEHRAAQARQALAEEEAERERCTEEMTAYEQGWRQSVAGNRPGDGTTRAWATAILNQVGVLAVADIQVDTARTLSDQSAEAWNRSLAHHRLAVDRARQEARKLAARQEEAQLLELADRFLIRRGAA